MTESTRHPPRQTTAQTGVDYLDKNNPRWNFSGFLIVKRRRWGPISVEIVDRAAGEAICRNDYHRLTYFLTDFHATMQDDERSEWECNLLRDHFVFRPPETTLRSNLTAGRYIQVLQHRDTYNQLASEMAPGVSSISHRDTTSTIR